MLERMSTERAPKAPAADATLRLLAHLAAQRSPQPAIRIAEALDLPRSTAYDLLAIMVHHGFALHLKEERTYAVGPAAYELAAGFARHQPIARVGRRVLERTVDAAGVSGHLAAMNGRDVVYIVEERAAHRPTLVTDVGVRLPAHLTATGRVMLAQMPPAHLRTLYAPGEQLTAMAFDGSPATTEQLTRLLGHVAADGVAWEHGDVSTGVSSVAAPVLDRAGWPVAALALTWYDDSVAEDDPERFEVMVRRSAQEVARILSGARG